MPSTQGLTWTQPPACSEASRTGSGFDSSLLPSTLPWSLSGACRSETLLASGLTPRPSSAELRTCCISYRLWVMGLCSQAIARMSWPVPTIVAALRRQLRNVFAFSPATMSTRCRMCGSRLFFSSALWLDGQSSIHSCYTEESDPPKQYFWRAARSARSASLGRQGQPAGAAQGRLRMVLHRTWTARKSSCGARSSRWLAGGLLRAQKMPSGR
mmetsp:Transcript_3863/g.6962  ORF Transcript_3863/g.6962 Transcript_3863/m.6962 type:complete len:213 (-) Transcript_3863:547-1185(-)